MFDWVLGRRSDDKGRKGAGKRPTYDNAKAIAAGDDVEARRRLARHQDLAPELLYFLASDAAAEVRREVAENQGTPLQADALLATDVDDDVRAELAHKIGRLAPNLTADESERLTTLVLEVLEVLARDEVPRIRAIISEEIKLAANVPHHLVRRLAEDIEAIVAAPVLEYSPLLSNFDLLEIIAGGAETGSLIALSRRRGLSAPVVDAVVAIKDIDAVAAILENHAAEISERTLDLIAFDAEERVEWHAPMVNRENLPLRTIRRIATFVSAALVDVLIERNRLAERVAGELRLAVRRRIDAGDIGDTAAVGSPADERAQDLFEAGGLDEAAVLEALEEADLAFARHALILLSGLGPAAVAKILESGSGKAITALVWKAGLGMAAAETVQRRLAHVPAKSLLKAEDGRFPLPERDLEWYIAYFAE
jgi:uncharacterized protein (DUF2336 family)